MREAMLSKDLKEENKFVFSRGRRRGNQVPRPQEKAWPLLEEQGDTDVEAGEV